MWDAHLITVICSYWRLHDNLKHFYRFQDCTLRNSQCTPAHVMRSTEDLVKAIEDKLWKVKFIER